MLTALLKKIFRDTHVEDDGWLARATAFQREARFGEAAAVCETRLARNPDDADALQALAADESLGGPVHGVVFRGRRYDTGDRADYLRSIVRLACEREDLGPDFRAWLRGYVQQEMPQGV